MVDFSKLVSLGYWTDTRPGDLSQSFEWFFIVVLIACYAIFAITKLAVRQQREKKNFIMVRLYNRVASLWLSLAVIFTFIFFSGTLSSHILIQAFPEALPVSDNILLTSTLLESKFICFDSSSISITFETVEPPS